MKSIRTIVPVVAVCAALLAGCSQGNAAEGSAPAADTSAVEETAPEPEMTNWYETSFYERPVAQIASDLELLSFEKTDDEYYEVEDGSYRYLNLNFRGAPGDVPVDGASDEVLVALTVEAPEFEEDAEEQGLDSLAEDAMPTGVDVVMFHPEADAGQYEALAQQTVEALGLEPFTEGSTDTSPFDETRMLGNYRGPNTANGAETEYMVMVTSNEELSGDPEFPLYVDVSLFYQTAYTG